MRLVFGVVLLVGLGLAGFAVYMAQGIFGQYEQAQQNSVVAIDIFVAARPLRYGQRLTPEDVRHVKWPRDSLPPGAFADPAKLFPNNNAMPRVILRSMEPNEPILDVKITEPGQSAGISTALSEGMRAFAINVDVSTGVSGFLKPSDRIDVFWSGRINNQNVTRLIQTAVKIIAIDQSADQDRSGPAATPARTVTVEVSPADVAALAQAQSTGRLSLALVGATDETSISGDIEVDQQGLLGIEEQAPAVEQERCFITKRNAGVVEQVEVPCQRNE